MANTFDTSDLQRLETAFAQAPDALLRELRVWMTESIALLQGVVQEKTPSSGAGVLRASIIGNVQDLSSGLGVKGDVSSALNYAEPVELGSRPHMPPVEPLIDWAQRKLGLGGKEAVSAAWRIARTIARRGTLGYGMFHLGWRDTQTEIFARFERAVDRAMKSAGLGK